MKFHQALLAGLTLLFPIATGLEIRCPQPTIAGINAACTTSCGGGCKAVCEEYNIPWTSNSQCRNTNAPVFGIGDAGNGYCSATFGNTGPTATNVCCVCDGTPVTATPTATPTATLTATPTAVPTATPTAVPAATPTVAPAPAPTPTGPPPTPTDPPPTAEPPSPPSPTAPPPTPTAEPPCDASCQGDPHFKTWRGNHFDYHGECDLVLLKSDKFNAGLGLDIHIRTKIRRHMSYISSAALRIGSDVLEVESQGVYWWNGVLNADLPAEFSGFAFKHTQPTDKQHVFEVHLGGRELLKLKTYKDFVSVSIEQGHHKHFGDSAGLMGDFRMGHTIARDGKTVIDDVNAFGQEWQVRDTEPSLFHTVRLPQHPQQVCMLPPPMQASQLRRRLSESSSVDQLAAEKACEHWGEGKDDCIFDVLTTGDLEMAVVGAY